MLKVRIVIPLFSLFLILLLSACGSEAETAASDPASYDNWQQVLDEARGQTVNFYMWGGQDSINTWVTGYVAGRVAERYSITLNMVPLVDTADAVSKVLNEKQAGRNAGGSVDLIWINGENFATMKQGDLLYGPWAQETPNNQAYVNWDDPSVAYDLGLAVDGYESPYGKAQFVMIYDSARVPEPPRTIDGLVTWIKDHPGQFTYPALPDFTGYGFVLHLCYHTAGGHAQFLTEFDQALFEDSFADCWALLNAIEPYLWRNGETYPDSHARHDDLFANGEVAFNMAWNPAEASAKIASGIFPQTTRTYVFTSGTLANTHYLAIPFNAAHKAAAMVVADFMLAPEAQLSKKDIQNWGDFPAIDLNLVAPEVRAEFEALPVGVATLSDAELAQNRLPELPAAWRLAVEDAWRSNVLER